MTETPRTVTAQLRNNNALQTLQTLTLAGLLLITIPSTIVSCYILYYGYQVQQALEEINRTWEKQKR